jgi:hypothetical protein
MRARAASELFVGGFTQVWLDVPVLSLAGLDDEHAERAVVFILTAALCRGATTVRIEQPDRARLARSLAVAEEGLEGAIERIDGENAALMGYFDVYLLPADRVSEDAVRALEARVTRALAE